EFQMFKYLNLLILFIVIDFVATLRIPLIKSTDYVIVASETSFFQTCDAVDNEGTQNINDLFELNLKHEYAEDMETLITNGNITVKFDAPPDQLIKFSLEVYEWKRGKWQRTIYSIKRKDFCKAAFSPLELWYSLTSQIKEEDRVCPPEKGTVYPMDNVENRVEIKNVSGIDVEGQYRLVAHFEVGEYSTCMAAIVNIWKD
ncbi:hypothetical protein DOY81_011088, partial [Sarcophaga bullata]